MCSFRPRLSWSTSSPNMAWIKKVKMVSTKSHDRKNLMQEMSQKFEIKNRERCLEFKFFVPLSNSDMMKLTSSFIALSALNLKILSKSTLRGKIWFEKLARDFTFCNSDSDMMKLSCSSFIAYLCSQPAVTQCLSK